MLDTDRLAAKQLQASLILRSACGIFVAIVISTTVSLVPLYWRLREHKEEELQFQTTTCVLLAKQYLDKLRSLTSQVGSRTRARQQLIAFERGEVDRATLVEFTSLILTDAAKSSEEIAGIVRFDARGKEIARTGKEIPAALWNDFLVERETDPQVATEGTGFERDVRVIPVEIGSERYAIAGAPIRDNNRKRIGTDLLLFSKADLEQLIRDELGFGKKGEVALGRAENGSTQMLFVLVRSQATGESMLREGLKRAANGETGILENKRFASEDAIAVYQPVDENWGLAIQISRREFYATIDRVTLFEGIGIGLLGLLGTYIFIRLLLPLTRKLVRREKELRGALADLNAILENMADGLLVADAEGRVTRYNTTFARLFCFNNENLTGKTLKELECQDLSRLVAKTQANPGMAFTVEVALAKQSVGQAKAAAIDRGDAVEMTGTVVLVRDITAEKEVDRMKTDFISTVSHELRTPLTSILGFASIVKEKLEENIFPLANISNAAAKNPKVRKTTRRVRENIDIIIAEAERLTTLINDVLDIAKMEAGKIEWNPQPIDLEEVLERSLAATDGLFAGTSLEIRRQVEPDLPLAIADRDRIIQVAINLISNAVKFTKRGSVTCRISRDGDFAVFCVSDTGIGIVREDLDKIFQKFQQVGETLTNKPKGTGLGLPICKQIVEHHGGRIWAESEFGKGSTFCFTLPLGLAGEKLNLPSQVLETEEIENLVRQLQERADATVNPGDRSQKTILVADDDPSIRELLRQSLESLGYGIREAKDGLDAIAQVKIHKPDLILLDVMMPQIGGFDVAAVLKSDPETASIPIVILSIVEDREQGYRLGVDRYLTKPIDTKELLRDIGRLLARGNSDKKILVVDRNASALRTLSEVLQAQGYQVCEASESEECIEKAVSLKPGMIIVDSLLSKEHNLIQTLRFEKGLENVFFILLGER